MTSLQFDTVTLARGIVQLFRPEIEAFTIMIRSEARVYILQSTGETLDLDRNHGLDEVTAGLQSAIANWLGRKNETHAGKDLVDGIDSDGLKREDELFESCVAKKEEN
jgi:hypothetical protein